MAQELLDTLGTRGAFTPTGAYHGAILVIRRCPNVQREAEEMKLTHSASAWAARLGMAALAFAAPLGAQNLVDNPGFETGDFTDWTQAGNTSATGVVAGCQHSGTYCAMLGPVGSNGYLLQQLLDTQAGHTYDVSFWLEHIYGTVPPEATFNAYWGDVLFFSSPGGFFTYTNYGAQMLALFPGTQLRFEFREDPAYWHLDDIVVTDMGVVPEPTTVVLLGTGLVGLAGFIRRRRPL